MIGLLIVHFTFSYFYTAPAPLNSQELESQSGNYMKPFFHQHWDLFAPEPPSENVTILISMDGVKWRDISAEIIQPHYAYRITHHGRLAIALGNAGLFASHEYKLSQLTDEVPELHESRDFLKELCRQYLHLDSKDDFEVKMIVEPILHEGGFELVW